jgi:AAA domain
VPEVFHRRELAEQMTQQLLRPQVLQEALRSGLFLSGVRRTGKSTFLKHDLIPALERAGAIVIYADLWENKDTIAPTGQILRAVREKLEELTTPLSAALRALRKVVSAEVAAHGLKLKFDLTKLGEAGQVSLAQAFTQLVDEAKTDLVLIVDEVQECLMDEEGQRLLHALKAARDAVNLRPSTPGHFLFVGTGSHRALLQEMATRRKEAFFGATSHDFPVLGADYVQYLFERLRRTSDTLLPSKAAAIEGFNDLRNRPEDLAIALQTLNHVEVSSADPDAVFRGIIAAQRTQQADKELWALERLGPLAEVVFERIASSSGEDARGIYSNEARTAYANVLGKAVSTEEVQKAVQALQAENLVMRRGHGAYTVADPFVRQIWLERGSPSLPPESGLE